VPDIGEWLRARTGKTLINFGASAAHMAARAFAKDKYVANLLEYRRIVAEYGQASSEAEEYLIKNLLTSAYDSLSKAEIKTMKPLLMAELEAGALGIGLPLG
jgi:hypothetical protein